MTLKHLIELIQTSAPELGETLCKIELNKALLEYNNATGIVAGKDTFAYSDFSDGSITLTASPTEITSFELLSETRSLKPAFTRSGSTITFDTDLLDLGTFTSLVVEYKKDPAALSALTDVPAIPAQFQEALAWRVLWKAGLRAGKERIVFFKSEWKEAVREGKIYANVQSGSRTVNLKNYEF